MAGNGSRVDDQNQRQQAEEQKMEEFFALVRRFREEQDRRKNELKNSGKASGMKNNKEVIAPTSEEEDGRSRQQGPMSWVPVFQVEDFASAEFKDGRNNNSLSFWKCGYEDTEKENRGKTAGGPNSVQLDLTLGL